MKYIYALLISLLLPTAVFAQSVPVSWLRNVASGFLTPLNRNDNVGIGTTTPFSQLAIENTDGSTIILSSTKNDSAWTLGSNMGGIDFYGSDASGGTKAGLKSYIRQISGNTTFGGSTGLAFAITQQTQTSPTQVMTITESANVGIGTTTPPSTSLLHVGAGTTGTNDTNLVIDSGSGTGAEPQLRFNRASTLKSAIYVKSDTEALTFYNGSDRMVISTAGNVGIGTTSPAGKLDIYGTSPTLYLSDSSSGTNWYTLNDGSYKIAQSGVGSRLTITSTGNVGIGTTTPWTKLAVTGSTTIAGGPLFVLGTSNTPIGADTDWYRGLAQFRKDINDYMYVTMENRNGGANASSDFIWNNDRTTSTTYYADAGFNSSGYNNPSYGNLNVPNGWYLYNTDGPTFLYTATTSPLGYIDFGTGGFSSSRLRITSTGFIGIGTTSPSQLLSLQSSTHTFGIVNTTAAGGNSGMIFTNSGDNNAPWTIGRHNLGYFFIAPTQTTNPSSESFMIDTAGSVGIATGTIALTAKFAIENTGSLNTFYAADEANDASPFVINSSGNVGISTSTPQSTLSVGSVNDATNSYAQIDSVNGAPTAGDCDTDLERGRMIIDYSNNRFYICNGATRGWDYTALTD